MSSPECRRNSRPPGRGGRLSLLSLLLAAVVLAGLLSTTAAARRPKASSSAQPAVPQGFVGVDIDGPMFAPNTTIDYQAQLQAMVGSGVQSVRVAFNWATAQPYRSADEIPAAQASEFTDVGGQPTNFGRTDEIVGEAAVRRISVLPTIIYAPSWDSRRNPHGVDIPQRAAPYAAYAAALVGRYGPHGSFWQAHPQIPRMPIRMWQIWNEPNISYYWPQPFARTYVPLLRLAHQAIKRADPGAKVVLGALTNFAWRALGQIYLIAGARNGFDVVALNGFTKQPANVILYMQFMRHAMSRQHDGQKPLLATEVSWPSAQGQTSQHFDFNTTQAGQARDIATVLPLIGANRVALHLIGFYYYTWIGVEKRSAGAFSFAGLNRLNGDQVAAKPALSAFTRGALALEGCRAKGASATVCLH
jgi:hypothetical protein